MQKTPQTLISLTVFLVVLVLWWFFWVFFFLSHFDAGSEFLWSHQIVITQRLHHRLPFRSGIYKARKETESVPQSTFFAVRGNSPSHISLGTTPPHTPSPHPTPPHPTPPINSFYVSISRTAIARHLGGFFFLTLRFISFSVVVFLSFFLGGTGWCWWWWWWWW